MARRVHENGPQIVIARLIADDMEEREHRIEDSWRACRANIALHAVEAALPHDLAGASGDGRHCLAAFDAEYLEATAREKASVLTCARAELEKSPSAGCRGANGARDVLRLAFVVFVAI